MPPHTFVGMYYKAQLQVGGEDRDVYISVLSPLVRQMCANHMVIKPDTTVKLKNDLIVIGVGKSRKNLTKLFHLKYCKLNINKVDRTNGRGGTSDSGKSHAEYMGNLLSTYLILSAQSKLLYILILLKKKKKQAQSINQNT